MIRVSSYIQVFIFSTLLFTGCKPEKPKPETGLPAIQFKKAAVSNDEQFLWFITEKGLVSYNGEKWTLHASNPGLVSLEQNDISVELLSGSDKAWIAEANGLKSFSFPLDAATGIQTYTTSNSSILDNNVISVKALPGSLQWIASAKGISAMKNGSWLDVLYNGKYPVTFFQNYPITCLATSLSGDTVLAGTKGAGVARVYRNELDGISGASEYIAWGPIDMPSDNVYSILVDSKGNQWIGTDKGVALHTGWDTLDGWQVFNTENGLVHNHINQMAEDPIGRIWFATKGGVSVYNNGNWTTWTEDNGLTSNNVLCIVFDAEGNAWLGTDKGLSMYDGMELTKFE